MSWLDLKVSPGTSPSTSLAPAPSLPLLCSLGIVFEYQIHPFGAPGPPLLRVKNKMVEYMQMFLVLITIPEHFPPVFISAALIKHFWTKRNL